MPREIDVRRKPCPIPVLMTKRALEKMRAGEVLKVVCGSDEFDADENILNWAKREGHEVLDATKSASGSTLRIRKR